MKKFIYLSEFVITMITACTIAWLLPFDSPIYAQTPTLERAIVNTCNALGVDDISLCVEGQKQAYSDLQRTHLALINAPNLRGLVRDCMHVSGTDFISARACARLEIKAISIWGKLSKKYSLFDNKNILHKPFNKCATVSRWPSQVLKCVEEVIKNNKV